MRPYFVFPTLFLSILSIVDSEHIPNCDSKLEDIHEQKHGLQKQLPTLTSIKLSWQQGATTTATTTTTTTATATATAATAN